MTELSDVNQRLSAISLFSRDIGPSPEPTRDIYLVFFGNLK